MTEPDDGLKRLEEALAWLKAVADAEHHVHLEQMFDASQDHSWPPAPNTAHPSLERHAEFVRQLMDRGEYRVLLAAPRPPLHRMLTIDPAAPIELDDRDPTVLDVRRAAGAAPWVGDPFVWEWRVAVDPKTNRWVAGDSAPRSRDRTELAKAILGVGSVGEETKP